LLIPFFQRLGFDTFTTEVEDVLKDHKQQVKVCSVRGLLAVLNHLAQDREKKVSKFEQSGLTEEELLAKQEELFAASRAKFQSTQQ
jgi:down-regulator of transcription 1